MSGLFMPSVTCHLTPTEVEMLMKPINYVERGDFQKWLEELQSRLQPDDTLVLEDGELYKCARHAYAYKGGGYQDQNKVVLAAARRAGWSQI